MGELFVHKGFAHYPEMLEKLADSFSQLNMQGAFSAEAIASFASMYNDQNLRTFWGTIAINMEYQLRSEFGPLDPIAKFINCVVSTIHLTPESVQVSSALDVSLAQPRLVTGASHGFENPVDFWIICWLAFRMTVGSSEVYPYFRQECALANPEKKPGKPIRGEVIVAG